MLAGFVELAVSEATVAPSSDLTGPTFAAADGSAAAGAASEETASADVDQKDFVVTSVAQPAFGISSAAPHATRLVEIASVAALGISAAESKTVRRVAGKAGPESETSWETSFC